jgi:hypothetical protein
MAVKFSLKGKVKAEWKCLAKVWLIAKLRFPCPFSAFKVAAGAVYEMYKVYWPF